MSSRRAANRKLSGSFRSNLLEALAKFHTYSLNNACLIFWQQPGATMVAGFNDWERKHGRAVRRGERAIWILVPVTRKVDVENERGEM